MSSTTPAPIALNDDAFAQAESLAWRDGVFAGLSCALVAGLISSRFYKFSPTKTAVASALTGVLSGVQFQQAFRGSALAQVRAERAKVRAELALDNPASADTDAAPSKGAIPPV